MNQHALRRNYWWGTFRTENEILDAKWFTFQEILDKKEEMRVDYVWKAIKESEVKEL